MKITIEIKDAMYSYFMDLLQKMDFVKVVGREKESIVSDPPMTHYASEKVLSKDWLTPEEDEAWKDL